MTAFKNLPPWEDFQKGQDSDMLRMRKRFTEMLDRKHTETMRKYSQFQTAEKENDAYEMWRERRERESKRRKVEPQQHGMPAQHAPHTVGRWPLSMVCHRLQRPRLTASTTDQASRVWPVHRHQHQHEHPHHHHRRRRRHRHRHHHPHHHP